MKITILNCLDKKISEKDLIPKKNGYMIVRYIFPNKKGKFLGLRNEKLLKDKKKYFTLGN